MSINKKLILLLVSLFLFSSVILFFFSLYSLRSIEEKQMEKVYEERLRILMFFIEDRYDALLDTGMADIYEEVYKKDLVRDLKQIYYNNVRQTYPFILDPDANDIMHPTILVENADKNENEMIIVNRIINTKNGSFEYIWHGNHKWCIFREFKPWNWYVVFTVDDSVRYDVVYQYLYKYSGVLLLVSGLIVLITVFILRKNLLDPLLLLKEKCKNVLDKDASSDFLVLSRKKDEIGQLASSFIEMESQLKES
ncbi:MAG: cache domain-containing protein, partial [Desulfobacteraceae bacterium]|nr:cache domain-containing protein [Desulfobacteraceae bacterium]